MVTGMLTMSELSTDAADLLRRLTGRPDAQFRDGQLEAIEALVGRRRRALVVQRTGWGKSAVYFIATRLLRDAGAGATVLVSPLLALMRNQIEMARRAGVKAATINSGNTAEWAEIEADVQSGSVDLLLVSPERLNNPRFRREVLPHLVDSIGLLVVDEAHCISDWGHDFRPDYRRIATLIADLPAGTPVLCTTATANDRVVADIVDQLGHDLEVVRGTLDRESLELSVIDLAQPAERLAWLARTIPTFEGSGIVYCLTIADAERVAGYLQLQGIEAMAYSGDSDNDDRLAAESALLDNRVKVLVATSALGMGFDKPDLGFVIHFQSPGSPIAYYQQVGRAGRAVARAHGILLRGREDRDIQDFFIRNAFPPKEQAEQVVALLADRGGPVGLAEIEREVNARHSRIETMLKVLEVEGAVERGDKGWVRTRQPWAYDEERVDRVTALRREEQAAMVSYATTTDCRMAYLRRALDDAEVTPCGRCDTCAGGGPALVTIDPAAAADALRYLRSSQFEIEPRRQWPTSLGEPRGRISPEERLEPGRALGVYGDGAWGTTVERWRRRGGEPMPGEVIDAAVAMINGWAGASFAWVGAVPSARPGDPVTAAAQQVAAGLGVPFQAAVRRHRPGPPQSEMQNSAQQVTNIYRAFALSTEIPPGPVLLVDDVADSRWTLTVVGTALRRAGAGPVHPFVFARSRGE